MHSNGDILNNRYQIIALLGQGGFGAVYKATDLNLMRPCAVKENFEVSEDAQRQFIHEASIMANMHHANLPRVTDYFIIPGQGQYLVMDFVEGEDLAAKLQKAGAPLSEGEVLEWIDQICDALAYLHGQPKPVIHRDIKPQNIIIGSDGRAMLVDFGVAKLYDPEVRTTAGARAVTPGFSPQEQYGFGITDHRSDIYALGATLYNLLTGRVPVESIQRTIGSPLTAPRQFNPQISPQVEAAILKAMQPAPGDRFMTIKEFKSALSRAPITEIPAGKRRMPGWGWLAVAGGVLMLVIVLGGVFGIYRLLSSDSGELPAVGITPPAVVKPFLSTAIRAPSVSPTPTIYVTPSPTPVQMNTPADIPTTPITAANAAGVVPIARYGNGVLNQVKFSPDESQLAAATTLGFYVYDSQMNYLLWSHEVQGGVRALAYSADGSLLAGGSDDAVIRVWNNQGGLLQTMQAGRYEEVAGLGFIPGENRLISIHGTEALYLWDIESGERISEYHSDMGYGWAYSAVVSSDGKWVTVIDDDQMTIFSLEDGHFNEVKTLHQLTTYCAFSPDDNFLAAFTQSGVVNIYSVGDWALVRAINVPSDATRLAYAPDGNVLAVGTTAGKVALFNAKTGEPYSRQLLSAHDGIINSLSFSVDGAILVTASEDGSLTAWRMPEGEKIIQVTGFNAAPVFVYMLHDQPLLVYGGGYPTQLNLIDPRNGAVQSMTTLENNSTMAQYPLRDLLITADYDNISSWDPVTNDLKNSDMYYYGSMTPNIMQFSPDGDWLAIGDWEGNLSVLSSRLFVELLDPEFSWETYQPPDDYYNSQLEWQLAGNTAEISGLAFSSDGRWFASSDYDGSLILWSVPEFNFSKNLKSVSNADAIAFSPANNYLAAGYVDGSINVIDPSTGEVVKTLWGATSSVSNVAYSPDGSILASASYEGAIALWDVESGEVLRLLEGHRGWVHALQFSPDGSLLISSSADGTVRLWGVR